MDSERRGLNAQGERRQSTQGVEGTNTGHEDGDARASFGVRLASQLGRGYVT